MRTLLILFCAIIPCIGHADLAGAILEGGLTIALSSSADRAEEKRKRELEHKAQSEYVKRRLDKLHQLTSDRWSPFRIGVADWTCRETNSVAKSQSLCLPSETRNVYGVDCMLLSATSCRMCGLQSAVFTADAGRLYGLQLSLAESSAVDLLGIQFSGISIIHGLATGIQIGLGSGAETLYGMQIGGVMSGAVCANGIQLGIFNWANSMNGIQIGLANNTFVDGCVLQIGLLNIVKDRWLPIVNASW